MTKYFLFLVGGMLAYEFKTLANKTPGDTISEIVWKTTADYPLLPFSMGVLMGHFFWQRNLKA